MVWEAPLTSLNHLKVFMANFLILSVSSLEYLSVVDKNAFVVFVNYQGLALKITDSLFKNFQDIFYK